MKSNYRGSPVKKSPILTFLPFVLNTKRNLRDIWLLKYRCCDICPPGQVSPRTTIPLDLFAPGQVSPQDKCPPGHLSPLTIIHKKFLPVWFSLDPNDVLFGMVQNF